ncbi:MAG: TasA family protein [Patescibacteria group bacterium]
MFTRLLLSAAVIIGAAAVIATGGTGAFFSDTETSSGNTFAAGAIDLKVDNESYYNLNKCTNTGTAEAPVWTWQGNAAFPVVGTPCTTSWALSDLDNGLLFFNFTDLKPDDEGEDTISLHVDTNDAYACLDITLTSNDDISTNEPELASGDVEEDINNTWDGELAQNIQMFWWADDGDNVYEEGENGISDGVQTLYNLATTSPFSVALADSQNNVWDPNNTPGPLPGDTTVYLAKAWCFGTLTLDPVAAGQGVNPSVDSGIDCDGTALGNGTQTDGTTLDVAFRVEQARNNGSFVCGDEETRTATLTVIKQVVNDNGGNNLVPDFQLFADNGVTEIGVTSGTPTVVAATAYTITEVGVSGYQASFTGDCNASGEITLLPGDNKTCTITNNDLPANITLIKAVVNDNGGTATVSSAWGLKIDGVIVPHNASQAVTSNAPHAISENGRAGYHFVSITGNPQCPAVLDGTATLNEGEAITCTITNDDN